MNFLFLTFLAFFGRTPLRRTLRAATCSFLTFDEYDQVIELDAVSMGEISSQPCIEQQICV